MTQAAPPQVLIVTRSDDNRSIEAVSQHLLARGAQPIRLDSDRYPDLFRVSTRLGGVGPARRRIAVGDDVLDLDRVSAVWYRRFHAGAALPAGLGDTRPACVAESRRTLFGFIAALPCFHLDPIESVRRTDHKELQLSRAEALGLEVPRTLISNDAAQVRAFYEECGGRVISKMQHSFAIYREGVENVVFTNPLREEDLDHLDGLRHSPMCFQEHLDKRLELRVTVVGTRVMAAAIDSQAREETQVDWRRDGVGLLDKWQPFDLPAEVERAVLALLGELGLNYGALDFILTPDDRLVFLEVNAVGEFFWLDLFGGLPITESIADVLLGRAERNPFRAEAWANFTSPPGDATG